MPKLRCGHAVPFFRENNFCEYCKYEMRDKEERAAATDETEPRAVREIHHVYEKSAQVPQHTRTRKKRSGRKIAVILCFLIPFLVIFFALREIPAGIVIMGLLLFLLV